MRSPSPIISSPAATSLRDETLDRTVTSQSGCDSGVRQTEAEPNSRFLLCPPFLCTDQLCFVQIGSDPIICSAALLSGHLCSARLSSNLSSLAFPSMLSTACSPSHQQSVLDSAVTIRLSLLSLFLSGHDCFSSSSKSSEHTDCKSSTGNFQTELYSSFLLGI